MHVSSNNVTTNLIWIAGCSITAIFALFGLAPAEEKTPKLKDLPQFDGVKVELSIDSEGELDANEPVILQQTLINESQEELMVVVGPIFYCNEIEVKTESGEPAGLTRLAREHIASLRQRLSWKSMRMASGEKRTLTIPLDRLFDMSTEGEYQVKVKIWFGVPKAGTEHTVTARPLTIKRAGPMQLQDVSEPNPR